MKKVLFLVTTLVISMFITLDVEASSFKAEFVGEELFEDTITLELKVDNLDGFTGSCNGLCGLVGVLNYDKEKLEIINISSLESFTLAQGKKLVLYKPIGVSNGKSILTLTLKNKGLSAGEETKLSLTEIVASDGDKDIVGNDVIKTIKLKEEVKDSSKEDAVSGKKEDEKSDTKSNISSTNKREEIVEKSTDNSLKEITLSFGNIEFDKNILVYSVTVDKDVEEIVVGAKVNDFSATVKGTGTFKLDEGQNVIKLEVQAEDGSKKTYTLNVYRETEENVIPVEDFEDEFKEEDTKENFNSVVIVLTIIVLFVVGLFVVYYKK